MGPYFINKLTKLYNKDSRVMKEVSDNTVQMVVTSPPYWGPRKYLGDQTLIWGENACEHVWQDVMKAPSGRRNRPENPPLVGSDRIQQSVPEIRGDGSRSSYCQICGAWRGEYGLEPTPSLYIAHSIQILREVRRVLKKDGVVFWNIGDTYITGKGSCYNPGGGPKSWRWHIDHKVNYPTGRGAPNRMFTAIPGKNLALIPQRLAIAAQDDGWWVRSVVIWNKGNAKPESVKDRPTTSHEYILILTKSKRYYWNYEAVLVPYTEPLNCWGGPSMKSDTEKTKAYKDQLHIGKTSAFRVGHNMRPNPKGKNIRTVWTFPTKSYHGAHFAVFPERLPQLCILAASRPGDLVLDCFAGSGTTLKVAEGLGRRSIGYEISKYYAELIVKRLLDDTDTNSIATLQ